jgi:hypothetical protein
MHMCTHAQNGFANSLKQMACTLFHARYFIDVDDMRFLRGLFSIAAHHLNFFCTLHEKVEVVCVILQDSSFLLIGRFISYPSSSCIG